MSGAADLLGVHANTVRAWTDQGLLTCLRINTRGDRRYRQQEIDQFLAMAKVETRPPSSGAERKASPRKTSADSVDQARRIGAVLDEVARLCAEATNFDRLVGVVAEVLCSVGGYTSAALAGADDSLVPLVGRMRTDRRVIEHVISARAPFVTRARHDDGTYRAGLPVPGKGGLLQVIHPGRNPTDEIDRRRGAASRRRRTARDCVPDAFPDGRGRRGTAPGRAPHGHQQRHRIPPRPAARPDPAGRARDRAFRGRQGWGIQPAPGWLAAYQGRAQPFGRVLRVRRARIPPAGDRSRDARAQDNLDDRPARRSARARKPRMPSFARG